MTTVTEDTTTEDLREAITHLAHDAARLPSHHVDKRAAMHREINRLLTELDARG